MAINDRMVTAATGIVLAMGAGILSVMMIDRDGSGATAPDFGDPVAGTTYAASPIFDLPPPRPNAHDARAAEFGLVTRLGSPAGDGQPQPRVVDGELSAPATLPPELLPPQHKHIRMAASKAPTEMAQTPKPVAPEQKPGQTRPETTATLPDQDLVFAAVQPVAQQDDTGPDLARFAWTDVGPELADLADIGDAATPIGITAIDTPPRARFSAVQPATGSGMKRIDMPLAAPVDCTLDVRATRLTGARVSLRLSAPCHPDVTVTIEHSGLRFKERLDSQGLLSLKVPVFTEYSRFDIRLSDGTRKTVGAYIADLSSVDRVGISFAGRNDTFLHAREGMARFDDPGHVWRMSPRSHAAARALGGGYMSVLGNPDLPEPELAQIYTLPRASNAGAVVSLDIETLREGCGNMLEIAVASHGAGRNTLTKRVLSRGAVCGSGQSRVLKNVLKAINVAAKQ